MDKFGNTSARCSPPPYDHVVWTPPYPSADTSKGSDPKNSGTIDCTEHNTNIPSPASYSLYEPVDDANSATTAPIANSTSLEDMNNCHGVDSTAFLASIDFTDEVLASLIPASESAQVPLGDSISQMWIFDLGSFINHD